MNKKEQLKKQLEKLIESLNEDTVLINSINEGGSNLDIINLMDFGITKKLEIKKQIEEEIKNLQELEDFIVSIINNQKQYLASYTFSTGYNEYKEFISVKSDSEENATDKVVEWFKVRYPNSTLKSVVVQEQI